MVTTAKGPQARAEVATRSRADDPWGHIAEAAPEGIDAVLDVVAGAGVTAGFTTMNDGARWVGARALADVHKVQADLATRSHVGKLVLTDF